MAMAAFKIGYGPSYQIIFSSVHLNPIGAEGRGVECGDVVRSRVILRI